MKRFSWVWLQYGQSKERKLKANQLKPHPHLGTHTQNFIYVILLCSLGFPISWTFDAMVFLVSR